MKKGGGYRPNGAHGVIEGALEAVQSGRGETPRDSDLARKMAQDSTSSHPSPPGGSGDGSCPREPVSAWIRSHGQGFQIGPWKVWPDRGELTDGATSYHLEPKGMEVLVYLALAADEVVSREKILEAVWPETFVQDSVLFRHVSDLRRILGDDVHNPRFIETIPKRGYRLIAAVSWLDRRCGREHSAAPTSTSEEPGKDSRPGWLTAVLAALTLYVLAVLWR